MCALVMPMKISMNFECINDILLQFNRCDPNRKEIIFDFSSTNWISAEMTPFLGNLVQHAQSKGYDIYFDHLKNSKVENLLQKNGFLYTYGLIENLVVDLHKTTIPYKVLRSNDDEALDDYLDNKVFPLIHKHLNENEISAIRDAVYEISHNVKDHSKDSDFFICGQLYPKKKMISLSLSDNGITIPKKIETKFSSMKQQKDSEKINWSTGKGNSTKHSASSGLGLYDIKYNIIGIGNFQIISRKGYWEQKSDGTVISDDLLSIYNGTFIKLSFLLYDHVDRVSAAKYDIINEQALDFLF